MAKIWIIAIILPVVSGFVNLGAVGNLNRFLKALDVNDPPDIDALLEVSEMPNNETSFDQRQCNDWYSMNWSFKKCLNVTETGLPTVSETLLTLKNFCGQQDVVELCMEEEFTGCENIEDLEAMLATSLSFCVRNNPPYIMELYLAFHTQLDITQECWMAVILDIQKYSLSTCSNHRREMEDGLVDQHRFWKSLIAWYAACAASQDLDITIEVCQVSRRQMYSLLIAQLQVMFGFGINHYPTFDGYMKIP